MRIIETIRSEIDDFIYNYIEVVPGYDFNQYETIKRIHLYDNNQFEDQSLYHGREKIFVNISAPRRDVVTRFLDIDTKDIRLYDTTGSKWFPIFILQSKLQEYLRREDITSKLNDIAFNLATYGSVVLEHTKEDTNVVDLRRLFIDPTVEDIKDSRFITIKYYFTPEKLRRTAEKNGWDTEAVERIIRKKQEDKDEAAQSYEKEFTNNVIRSTSLIEIYKRYGLLPEKTVGGNSDREVMTLSIVAEPHLEETNEKGEKFDKGEVLYAEKWTKEVPIEDCHLVKTKGRWLGKGIYETLFPIQERINEITNQLRVSMEISSIHLFQTSDATVFQNVLTDMLNGDIIRTKKDNAIQPIVTEERNLPAFENEYARYTQLGDRASHAGSFISGEDVPSTTPATNAVITNNNNVSIHLFRREYFADFIRKFILRNVIPQILKDLNKADIMRFVGSPEDLKRLDEMITEMNVNKTSKERALSMEVITPEFQEEIRQETRKKLKKQGTERYLKSIKQYFKGRVHDGDFGLDINVDNEQEDWGVLANNIVSFAQFMSGANMQDPVIQEITKKYGEYIGMDVGKLELAMQESQQIQTEQGGQPQPPQQLVEQMTNENQRQTQ